MSTGLSHKIGLDQAWLTWLPATMDRREIASMGGRARASGLSAKQRSAIAKTASLARWGQIAKHPCPLCNRPLGHGKLRRGVDGRLMHDRPFCDELDVYRGDAA